MIQPVLLTKSCIWCGTEFVTDSYKRGKCDLCQRGSAYSSSDPGDGKRNYNGLARGSEYFRQSHDARR